MSQYEVVVAEMLLEIDINISQRKFLSILFDKVSCMLWLSCESWMFKIFQTCENFLDIEIEKRLMLPRRRSQLLFPLDDDGKNQNSKFKCHIHSSWVARSYHIFATTIAVVRPKLERPTAEPKVSTRHRCREMSYYLWMINDGNFSNSQKRNCHYTIDT